MKNQDLFAKLDSIQNTRFQLKSKRMDIMPPSAEEIYNEKTKDLTVQDIENMSAMELLNLNQIDDETVLLGIPDFENIEDSIDYLRSLYVFLKQSDEMIANMDKAMNDLNEILEEGNKELSKIMLENGDKNVVKLIENSLLKSINKAESEVERAKLIRSKSAFDDSFDLTRLINLYKEISSDNIKREAETQGNELYKKYVKTNKELGLTFDLTRIVDFESKYLPEEYHELNNLFVVICIKYISKLTKNRGAVRGEDGLFASQLTTNLYLLEEGNLPDEYKERLLKSVQTLLDVVR